LPINDDLFVKKGDDTGKLVVSGQIPPTNDR
jgi:hypothetical protein